MGKSTISTGSFSIAMLVYQRVACQSVFVEPHKVMIKVMMMMIEAEIGGVSVIPIVWLVMRYGYNVVCMCMQITIKHGDIAITVVNMTSWWLQIVVQPVINRGCANNTREYRNTSQHLDLNHQELGVFSILTPLQWANFWVPYGSSMGDWDWISDDWRSRKIPPTRSSWWSEWMDWESPIFVAQYNPL